MILLITILNFIPIMSNPMSTFDKMFALVRLSEAIVKWYRHYGGVCGIILNA